MKEAFEGVKDFKGLRQFVDMIDGVPGAGRISFCPPRNSSSVPRSRDMPVSRAARSGHFLVVLLVVNNQVQ